MISPLSRLWKDRMDIYRYVEIEVNGFTRSKEKLLYQDVKCKYSKGSLNDAGEGVPELKNNYILFCGLDTDLQEGDKIIVTQRNGRNVTLKVGEGFPYSNHQEFYVTRNETI